MSCMKTDPTLELVKQLNKTAFKLNLANAKNQSNPIISIDSTKNPYKFLFEDGSIYVDIPTKGRHDSALKFPIYSGAKVASWIC